MRSCSVEGLIPELQLIDDDTKYSNQLKELLYDLVKDSNIIPSSMVINGVRKTREAAIASGGMADIFQGEEETTGRILALKVPRGVTLEGTEKPKHEDKMKLEVTHATNQRTDKLNLCPGRIHGGDGMATAES